MRNIIIDFLKINNLCLDNETIVVGVSTGVDSMVLLDELMRAQDEGNFNIVVAHVNHQKRKQSIEEEAFIKEFCQKHKIKIYIKRLNVLEIEDGNFQSLARNKRYDFFKEIMSKHKAKYLFLGHHANDNIETIIMRLIRGSNLSGYSGMDLVTPLDSFFILRPFLNTLKKDILEISKQRNIKYYEDASNKDACYTRNRIREDIVPLFFMENANVDRQLDYFSWQLKSASVIISRLVDTYIKTAVVFHEYFLEFDRDYFLKQDLFLQTEILFSLTKHLSLSKANIDELLKLINSKKVNLLVNYKENLTFVREYNKIKLYFYNISFEKTNLVIDNCGSYDIDENRQIIVAKKSNNILTNLNTLWYNSNMLPITIRSREEGDRIVLSSGSKKVSDLLIDKKIGILQREQVLIVADKDNNILSVLGVKKSTLLKSVSDCDIIITLKEKN